MLMAPRPISSLQVRTHSPQRMHLPFRGRLERAAFDAELFSQTMKGGPRLRLRAYPKTVCGEGDRHILLRRLRKMSQSPTVFG